MVPVNYEDQKSIWGLRESIRTTQTNQIQNKHHLSCESSCFRAAVSKIPVIRQKLTHTQVYKIGNCDIASHLAQYKSSHPNIWIECENFCDPNIGIWSCFCSANIPSNTWWSNNSATSVLFEVYECKALTYFQHEIPYDQIRICKFLTRASSGAWIFC